MSLETPSAMLERYARGHQELITLLASISPKAIQFRPSPDHWTIHEFVWHLVEADLHAYVRCRKAITEQNPHVLGYDQDAWRRRPGYHKFAFDKALDLSRLARYATVVLLRNLSQEIWARTLTHERHGLMALSDWLSRELEHRSHHLHQIQLAVESWRGAGTPNSDPDSAGTSPSVHAISNINSYRHGAEELDEAIASLPVLARYYRSGPDRWSIQQIVIHVTDSEINGYLRRRSATAEPGRPVMLYDQDIWAEELQYDKQEPVVALAMLKLLREISADELMTLPDSTFENHYTHPEAGDVNLTTWLGIYTRHIHGHIKQMQECARLWKASLQ